MAGIVDEHAVARERSFPRRLTMRDRVRPGQLWLCRGEGIVYAVLEVDHDAGQAVLRDGQGVRISVSYDVLRRKWGQVG
jgi:hypothetical protein